MARVKSIEEQIKALSEDKNLGRSALIPEAKLESLLLSETRRLKELLAKYIRAYYASYTPVVPGHRDGDLAELLTVKYSREDKSAYIYFGKTNNDEPWKEGVVRRDFRPGFVPVLIDTGWRVKPSAKHANVYRFGYYEGYHFIEKAIEEFNRTNKYGLYVRVNAARRSPNANFMDYDTSRYVLSSEARDAYDRMGRLW